MKRNELKEIVDREFSGLTWDENKSRRVLDALDASHTFPALPARRKLPLAIALAALLTLLTATALAVALIRYSPRVSLENQARQLLMAQYGLTRETLGLFHSEVAEADGETVVTFRTAEWDDELAGVYTVRFQDGQSAASWSHDDADPALWEGGDFSAPIWGPPQLAAYLAEGVIHDASSPYRMAHQRDHAEIEARPTPQLIAAYWDGEEWLYGSSAAEGDITRKRAEQIARQAIMDTYGLSEEEMAGADFFDETLIEGSDGSHFWEIRTFVILNGIDLCLYVSVDAQTEEVLRIGLETGGNG